MRVCVRACVRAWLCVWWVLCRVEADEASMKAASCRAPPTDSAKGARLRSGADGSRGQEVVGAEKSRGR